MATTMALVFYEEGVAEYEAKRYEVAFLVPDGLTYVRCTWGGGESAADLIEQRRYLGVSRASIDEPAPTPERAP